MEVGDKRKMTLSRMNPWFKYVSVHLCPLCEKILLVFFAGWMKGKMATGPSGEYTIFPNRDYDKDYWAIQDEVTDKLSAGEPVYGE